MEKAYERVKEILSRPLTLSLALTVIAMMVYGGGTFFARIDLVGRDFMFRLRKSVVASPAEVEDIILVTVDDDTAKRMTKKWPFPRSLYADAINKISKGKPKVIGFDFVFQGADEISGSDEKLSQALKKAGNVVIASYLSHDGQLISGYAPIREAAHRSAIVNKIIDRDGVVRRAPLYFKSPETGNLIWSWESEVFFKAVGITHPKLTEEKNGIVISNGIYSIRVPARNGLLDVNYSVHYQDIPRIPFWRVIEEKYDPDLFRGKIVLTGLTALAFHDFHKTPLGTIQGLTLNTNTILTLLQNRFLTRVSLWLTWLLIWLSLWFILRVTDRYSILTSFFAVFILAFVYLAISGLLLYWNVIWDLTYAAIVSVLSFFFAVLFKQFRTALENIQLREESVRDPLTGFYTRRFMEVHLRMDVNKVLTSGRHKGPINCVSIVMIDLDNFKLVNDFFGHLEGDRVLKMLGETIRKSVRKDELVCRFGGDEFCVILPGAVLEDAIKFSEKLRHVILDNKDLHYTSKEGVKTFHVTGSFGVAAIKGKQAMSSENLLKAADRALYRAKKGGRNQVCVYDPEKDVLDGD